MRGSFNLVLFSFWGHFILDTRFSVYHLQYPNRFLAALSSTRRLVVCPSVCPSVGPSVGPSVCPSVGPLVGLLVGPLVGPLEDLCEKMTFRVSNAYLNLPTYLCNSSDSCDSCDSCDSSDSSDICDSSDISDSSPSSQSSEEEEKFRCNFFLLLLLFSP